MLAQGGVMGLRGEPELLLPLLLHRVWQPGEEPRFQLAALQRRLKATLLNGLQSIQTQVPTLSQVASFRHH